MNSHQRRFVNRLTKTILAGVEDRLAKQEQKAPLQKAPRWKLAKAAKTAIASALSAASLFFAAYQAWPSWSVSSPTSAYHPHNPFTAIFSISNTGYIPAYDMKIECTAKRITYANNPSLFSGPITSTEVSIGDIHREDTRTFSCPQMISGIKIKNYVMSREEIRREFEEGREYIAKTGHMPGEDMDFASADFEFQMSYRVIFPWFHSTYRMVGKTALDGSFLWEQVNP